LGAALAGLLILLGRKYNHAHGFDKFAPKLTGTYFRVLMASSDQTR